MTTRTILKWAVGLPVVLFATYLWWCLAAVVLAASPWLLLLVGGYRLLFPPR